MPMTSNAVRIILKVLDAGGRFKPGHPPYPPVRIAIKGHEKLKASVRLHADEIRRHLIGHETLRPLERVWEACVKDIGCQWEKGGMTIWASDVELEDKIGMAMKLDPPDPMAVQHAIAAWRSAWLEQLKPRQARRA